MIMESQRSKHSEFFFLAFVCFTDFVPSVPGTQKVHNEYLLSCIEF